MLQWLTVPSQKSHIKSHWKSLRMWILLWFAVHCTFFSSVLQRISIFNGKTWKNSHSSVLNSSFPVFHVCWGMFSVPFESISHPFFPHFFFVVVKNERFIRNERFIHSSLSLFFTVSLFHETAIFRHYLKVKFNSKWASFSLNMQHFSSSVSLLCVANLIISVGERKAI